MPYTPEPLCGCKGICVAQYQAALVPLVTGSPLTMGRRAVLQPFAAWAWRSVRMPSMPL